VAPEKRLKIERCNARISFTKPQKEETYQVTLDALKLSLCYPAFQITAEVPEIYMHQFWNTIKKIGKTYAYDFKMDKKKCISGKSTGLYRLRESRAQILWAMYNQKNVDYVALLWEDFMYQADNKEISSARKEHMPYPRFTKVIIDHFISKEITICMRNRINLHTTRDDSLLGALKFVSKTEDCQKYGALIPDGMINDDIKLSTTYKTYLDYAIGKVPPKKARKFKKHASPKLKIVLNKALTKIGRVKGIELLLDAALLEEAQMKNALKKNESDDVNDKDDDDDDNRDDDNSNDNDDGGNDDGGNEDDYEENPSFTLKDYEEEEQDEE
ncbi:hypothetical protein Tco_1363817, partial [Tanacetum coccineum]